MITRTVPAARAADQTPHPARPAGTHPLWPVLAVLAVPVAMVAAGLVRPSPAPAAWQGQVLAAHAAADAPAGPPAGPRSRPAAEPPPSTGAVSLAAAHLQAARAARVDPDALAAYVVGRRGVLLDAVPIVVEAAGGGGDGEAGRQQLVLTGSGAGCASCHATWIAVWDARARAVVWEAADGRDTTVRPLPGGAGFARADSVRLEGEPSCCPSRREERALVWDGTTFTDAAAGADPAAEAEAGAPPAPPAPAQRSARQRPGELASAASWMRRG